MSDFVIENGVLIKYQGNAGDVVIPEGVTAIGALAFADCKSLSSVSIPSSVKSIDKFAFSGCTKLTSITIPNSVTSIGESTFFKCSALKIVKFEQGSHLKSIGDTAFLSCESLLSIDIPDGVKSIGDAAFSGCKRLKDVEIPQSVTHNAAVKKAPKTSVISINKGSITKMIPLLFGIVAIIILLTGVQLATRREYTNHYVSGGSSMNMYSAGWYPLAIITIMLVVCSGLFTYLRIDSNPNRYMALAMLASWLSVAIFYLGGMIWSGTEGYIHEDKYGLPTWHKTKDSVTFWFWVVVILLICYAIGITRNYILSKDVNDDTK